MTRFILFLLGKTGYEPCKSCETLKAQLNIANHEKEVMTQTLLDLLKPQVQELPSREVVPVATNLQTWSRRRAILETQDREAARIATESKLVGKPDSIKVEIGPTRSVEELEKELGVEQNA